MPLIGIVLGGIGRVFSALFTFFITKPGCYIGIALLCAAVFWWQGHRSYAAGLAQGRTDEAQHIKAAELASFKDGLRKQQDLDKGLQAAADRAGYMRGKADANTIFLTKEVTHYVPLEIDRLYPLPCGLIRLLDAAAAGTRPANLGGNFCGPDGSAAPVKASDLANVAIFNYGLYHRAEAKVIGLQDSLRAVVKTLGGKLEITHLPADSGEFETQTHDINPAPDQQDSGTNN